MSGTAFLRRRASIFATAAVGVLGAFVVPQAGHGAFGASQAGQTISPSGSATPSVPVVSLTFDGGTADHLTVARILEKHGLRGVFFVSSGTLGASPEHLTVDQARALQSRGHEIGGSTVRRPRLAQLSHDEQRREICVDRNQLLESGMRISDFAYPNNDFGSTAQGIVKACGYQSGRALSGVESLPPANRFKTRALAGFGAATTAADLIDAVKGNSDAGGWVQFAFRRVCAGCAADAVRRSEFVAFVRWLTMREAAGAVRVATVNEIVSDKVLPPVAPPPASARRLGFGNASFEQDGRKAGSAPACFSLEGSAAWETVPEPAEGRRAVQATVSEGGARLETAQDLGDCAPAIVAGGRYRVGFWYRATGPVEARSYARHPQGDYRSFGPAAVFPPAAAWTLASMVTGPAPEQGKALSVALTMRQAGTYLFDGLSLGRDTEPRRQGPPRPTAVPSSGTRPTLTPTPTPTPTPTTASASPEPSRGPVPVVTAPFLPPDPDPLNPLAVGLRETAELTGRPKWLRQVEIAGMLVLAFAAVAELDRRFRRLHQRTLTLGRAKQRKP